MSYNALISPSTVSTILDNNIYAARLHPETQGAGSSYYATRLGIPTTTPSTIPASTSFYPNYITDINDPYAINSLADVVLNRGAWKQRYGDWGNAITGPIIAAADLLWSGTIKPVVGSVAHAVNEGGLSSLPSGLGRGLTAAGINALVNAAETLDMTAQPIKATAIEGLAALGLGDYGAKYQGNIAKGLQNVFGFGDDGRVDYSWDTGHGLLDFGLEVISEPGFWVNLATGLPTSSTIQKMALGLSDEVPETLVKPFSNLIKRAYLNSGESFEQVVYRMLLPNSAGDGFRNPAMNKLLGSFGQEGTAFARAFSDAAAKGVLEGVDKLSFYRGARGFIDKIEKNLLRGTLASSGISPAVTVGSSIFKKAAMPIIKAIDALPEQTAARVLNSSLVETTTDYLNKLPFRPPEIPKNADNLTRLKEFSFFTLAVAEVFNDPILRESAEKLIEQYTFAQLPMDPLSLFVYHKIAPIFKHGFLSVPGFPMRNMIAAITNNAIQMGGVNVTNISKAASDFVEAIVDERRYQFILRKAFELGQQGFEVGTEGTRKYADTITSELLTALYKNTPDLPLPKDVFYNYHLLNLDASSVLGGMSAAARNIMEPDANLPRVLNTFNTWLERSAREGEDALLEVFAALRKQEDNLATRPKTVRATIWKTFFAPYVPESPKMSEIVIDNMIDFINFDDFLHRAEPFSRYMNARYGRVFELSPLAKLMDANPILKGNEAAERAVRWAMYKEIREQGVSHGDAIQNIIKTHFIYNDKPLSLKYIETYFPFTGFTLDNFKYWKGLVETNPTQPFAKKAANLSYDEYLSLMSGAIQNTKLQLEAVQYQDLVRIGAPDSVKNLARTRRKISDLIAEVADTLLGSTVSSQTKKSFMSNARHFQLAFGDRAFSEQAYHAYIKSFARPPTQGRSLKVLSQATTALSNLRERSDPSLIDHATRERPEWWSLSPEHPYMNLSQSAQYNIISGNLVYGDPVWDASDPKQRRVLRNVLKLNPPWLDALQFGITPVSSVTDRLLPIFDAPLRYREGDDVVRTILETLPIIGSAVQRYRPVANRIESTKNLMMLEPSIFGTESGYPLFGTMEDPSEELKKLWYGQLKGMGSTLSPYAQSLTTDQKSAAERELGALYAIYKTSGLGKEYDPYQRFPELVAQAHEAKRARYGTFNPVHQLTETPTEQHIKFWYQDYKRGASFNPYDYYTVSPEAVSFRKTSSYHRPMQRVQRIARPRNFYKNMYTAKGLSRMQMTVGRVTSRNLQYRTANIKYLFKKFAKRYWHYLT